MDINLTKGKVSLVLLHFAIPLLLANILQQLYTIVDSIIVGQYIGKEALAAVTAVYPIFYFLISPVIGIGGGISVLVSHCYGRNFLKEVQRLSSTYFIFLLAIGTAIGIAGILLGRHIFSWIGTPEDVIPDAVNYFQIYISGTFFYIAFNGIISILRGIGNSFVPLCLMFLSVLLNFLLDMLFIVVCGYGVEGAAWATLIAQAVTLLLSFYYLNREHTIISFNRSALCFDSQLFLRGLNIGIPSGVQQFSISLGMVAFLAIVNTLGTDVLTAYGVVGRIESIIAQPMLVLGSALASFTGQNIGAGYMHRAKRGFRITLLWGFLVSLFIAALILWGSPHIISLFTDEKAVIEIGSYYLIIVFGFYFLNSSVSILNGFLRGAGDTLFPMLVSIISLWLVRIPLSSHWSEQYAENGLWWSIVISWIIALLITLVYYYSGLWKKKIVRVSDLKTSE